MPTQKRARLNAQRRDGVRKKSELKALRRSGIVPALIYGHGEPETIQVDAKSLSEYLRRHAPGALMDLDLDGQTTTALIRELDRDGLTGNVIHLGFQRVDLRENIRATIPVVFHGEQDLIGEGLVLERQFAELEVHGQADQLPESIVVEVGTAAAGDTVRIGDLQLPQGIEPVRDADTVLARISAPTAPADVEAALDAEEAAHAALHAGIEQEEEAAEEVSEETATA